MELLKYMNNIILIANAYNNNNIKVKIINDNLNWRGEDLSSCITVEVFDNDNNHITADITLELFGPVIFEDNSSNKLNVTSITTGALIVPIIMKAPGQLKVGIDLEDDDLKWNY